MSTDVSDDDVAALQRKLAAPFGPADIKFKPKIVNGNQALALAYIDARAVQDRLDDVLGFDNWQDKYHVLNDGSVICSLSVRVDPNSEDWIVKTDVGSLSEQKDEGDRLKAAFSDALKRTAVKYGIGRYLYAAPPRWHEYDPVKKVFKSRPPMPQVRGAGQNSGGGNPPPGNQGQGNRSNSPRITQDKMATIDQLCRDIEMPVKWLSEQLMTSFGKNVVADLDMDEAARTIKGLQDRKRRLAEKGAAAAASDRSLPPNNNGSPPQGQPDGGFNDANVDNSVYGHSQGDEIPY